MSYIKTEPGADPIIVEGHYPVRPARVFKAWTDPDTVKKWFGSVEGGLASVAIDLRPGGRWRFTEHANQQSSTQFEGKYLKILPDKLLVFTWSKVTTDHTTGKRDSTPDSRVEIHFMAAADGTDMRITHSTLDTESRIGFRIGWAIGATSLATLLTTETDYANDPAVPKPARQ